MAEKPSETQSITYGLIDNSEVIIYENSNIDELVSKGYGELMSNGALKLTPYEALYLVENNKLIVRTKSGVELEFNELLRVLQSVNPQLWLLYVIYRDLRRRGYIVKEGFGGKLAFRVYEKGKEEASYLIYPFFEGSPENIANLLDGVKHSISKNKQLIVAVVERRGEVIYYSCSEASLKNI
ncbi:MAG: tRNA-intron lyase [Halobacteria archaeon]